MAILQKLVSHGGKRLSLYADKGCHLRKMAALLFPEESSTILRLPFYSHLGVPFFTAMEQESALHG